MNTDLLPQTTFSSVPPPEFTMFIDSKVVNSRSGVIEYQPELDKKLTLLKYFFNKRTGLSLQLSENQVNSGLTIPNLVFHNGYKWAKMKKYFKISIINNNKAEPIIGDLVSELMSLTKYLSIYTSLEWSASEMTAMTVTNLYVDSPSQTTLDNNKEIYTPYEIPVSEYYKPITKSFDTTPTTLIEDVRNTNSTVVTNKKKSLASKFYDYITNW